MNAPTRRACAGRRRRRSCRRNRRSFHFVSGGYAGRRKSGTGRDHHGSRNAGAVGSSAWPRLGAAATAQAPLGLLVASRSPPLRVAVEVTVRDPFADGEGQSCASAAISSASPPRSVAKRGGPAAADFVHSSINLALIA
jgi:hypothetical protein